MRLARAIATIVSLSTLIAGETVAAREMTAAEKADIAAAVKAKLKDPEAARFVWPQLANDSIYCGIVNGKNSYGGYVGDAPFIVGLGLGPKGRLRPVSLDIGTPRDETRTTAEILSACEEAGYSLVLSGDLPSAMAQRLTRRGAPTTMTPEEIDRDYQKLNHRLDRSEGVCKTKAGEYIAMSRTACGAQGGRVLGY